MSFSCFLIHFGSVFAYCISQILHLLIVEPCSCKNMQIFLCMEEVLFVSCRVVRSAHELIIFVYTRMLKGNFQMSFITFVSRMLTPFKIGFKFFIDARKYSWKFIRIFQKKWELCAIILIVLTVTATVWALKIYFCLLCSPKVPVSKHLTFDTFRNIDRHIFVLPIIKYTGPNIPIR